MIREERYSTDFISFRRKQKQQIVLSSGLVVRNG